MTSEIQKVIANKLVVNRVQLSKCRATETLMDSPNRATWISEGSVKKKRAASSTESEASLHPAPKAQAVHTSDSDCQAPIAHHDKK